MSMAIAHSIVNVSLVVVTVYTKSMPRFWVVIEKARVSVVVVMVTEAHVQGMCETIPRIEIVKQAWVKVVSMTKIMVKGTRNSMKYRVMTITDPERVKEATGNDAV